MKHIPVLLDAVMDVLGDIRAKTIVDATFGAGGYTERFLDAGAKVIAFDRDPNVIGDVQNFRKRYGDRFTFIPAPFSEIGKCSQTPDAIVFDFGVSSMQIDTATRGFSFRFDGPLDMRMGGAGRTAADLIREKSADDLAQILRNYGDLKKAKLLAKIIKDATPESTLELKNLIKNPNDIAPVFQALRIAVNDELGEIERTLADVPGILASGGICACVTFHSLEDRIVKNTFREWTTTPGDPRMPQLPGVVAPFENLTRGGVKPTVAELDVNPRARSAHLRAVRKIKYPIDATM